MLSSECSPEHQVDASSPANSNHHRTQTVHDHTTASSYRLPEYLHSAPMPRPRPTAEAAARARAARQGRAERGASTAADERADLEERVSAYLSGVVPEEYYRDAPPTTKPADSETGKDSMGDISIGKEGNGKPPLTRCKS